MLKRKNVKARCAETEAARIAVLLYKYYNETPPFKICCPQSAKDSHMVEYHVINLQRNQLPINPGNPEIKNHP